ncbi:glycosyltransferase family 4 protein [Patescibacteria group bacterium]|nr:glycosyltransferase family 4 protein [Patescibacteria group bacterium]
MKLLLSTLEYPPQIGGVANYYHDLIEAWPEKDAWTVLDNRDKKLLAVRGFFPWRRAILRLIKEQTQHKFDLIFIGQVLPLGIAALIAQVFKPFAYGVFLHGMDFTFALRSARKRWLLSLILKKSTTIICANFYVKKLLLEFLPEIEHKSFMLNPGAKLGRGSEEAKKALVDKYELTGKKIIFSIGRLVKRKGFNQVILALENIAQTDWVYLLAGDGPELASLQALANKSKFSNRIKFIGRLNEAEKWSCLELCDIFITTSRDLNGDFEGFGIVYLEAALMSKPVIAGLSGGVADAVIDTKTGLLVDSENIESISQALNKLLNNEDLAKELGKNAYLRASSEFNWPAQAEKLSKYLQTL